MEKYLATLSLVMLIGIHFQLQAPINVDLSQQFKAYEIKFNKQYTNAERAYRYQVYLVSIAEAQIRNARNEGAKFGETQFTDMTKEEFALKYLTFKFEKNELQTPTTQFLQKATFTPVDWREKGAVNPVKDMLSCSADWSFSTIGVLEGFFKVTQGVLPSLSAQQLIDCSTWIDFNYGCNGGVPFRALKQVQRNGITTEEEYQYTAQQQACAVLGGPYNIQGTIELQAMEEILLKTLEKQPVLVAVDASNWKDYVQGTFLASQCDSQLNYNVLAVGFTDQTIIIKNQWGLSWGEAGYINLELGKNTCGVADYALIPY